MNQSIQQGPLKKQIPLKALVEIVGGELKIFPIAQNDEDEQEILTALRFFREGDR